MTKLFFGPEVVVDLAGGAMWRWTGSARFVKGPIIQERETLV